MVKNKSKLAPAALCIMGGILVIIWLLSIFFPRIIYFDLYPPPGSGINPGVHILNPDCASDAEHFTKNKANKLTSCIAIDVPIINSSHQARDIRFNFNNNDGDSGDSGRIIVVDDKTFPYEYSDPILEDRGCSDTFTPASRNALAFYNNDYLFYREYKTEEPKSDDVCMVNGKSIFRENNRVDNLRIEYIFSVDECDTAGPNALRCIRARSQTKKDPSICVNNDRAQTEECLMSYLRIVGNSSEACRLLAARNCDYPISQQTKISF